MEGIEGTATGFSGTRVSARVLLAAGVKGVEEAAAIKTSTSERASTEAGCWLSFSLTELTVS